VALERARQIQAKRHIERVDRQPDLQHIPEADTIDEPAPFADMGEVLVDVTAVQGLLPIDALRLRRGLHVGQRRRLRRFIAVDRHFDEQFVRLDAELAAQARQEPAPARVPNLETPAHVVDGPRLVSAVGPDIDPNSGSDGLLGEVQVGTYLNESVVIEAGH
jgi:hypothetical protein